MVTSNSVSANLSTCRSKRVDERLLGLDASPLHRLITIYDCKVDLKWTGKAADGTEVAGKLTIPEVSHEITLDGTSDYVVCIPNTCPSYLVLTHP